jgi:N-methylhydantoinase A
MRYPGQNFALTFDVVGATKLHDLGFIDDGLSARATELFNARHMAEYNHIREHETPEIAGVRLVARSATPSPGAEAGFTAAATTPSPAKTRRANLGAGFADTPVFKGSDLSPGSVVTGPAIIEETFTTIVVYPGWKARLDDAADYELIRA